MKHGSLFSGIGGFDLSAEWMGWENIFQCEINPYCNKLLNQNFPSTIKHGDIKQTDFRQYRGAIDILSGGFPCQPYSSAGKRKGKDDERHLWPEMLRAIREIQSPWVVGENVRGFTNWNKGLVFDEVQSDLETAGYEVTPFLLPAAGVNAPHERYRIWFIAYSERFRCSRILSAREGLQWTECPCGEAGTSNNKKEIIANTNNKQRCKGRLCPNRSETPERYTGECNARIMRPTWEKFPTESPLCGRNDGVSFELDLIKRIEHEKGNSAESITAVNTAIWTVLREMWVNRKIAAPSPTIYVDRIYYSLSIMPHGSAYERWNMGQRIEENKGLRDMWESFYTLPFQEAQDMQQKLLVEIRQAECTKKMEQTHRVDRIKALGNAVVPQVVYQIFKAIEEYETLHFHDRTP